MSWLSNQAACLKMLTDISLSVSHALTNEFCDGCAFGKTHQKHFKSRPYRAMSTGEIINADVNGPVSVASFSGARYYVCFKDFYSKYRKVLYLKKKSDGSCCLCMFLNEADNHCHAVKALCFYGGIEFDFMKFYKFLLKKVQF